MARRELLEDGKGRREKGEGRREKGGERREKGERDTHREKETDKQRDRERFV